MSGDQKPKTFGLHEWEPVGAIARGRFPAHRMQVPGGWIYVTTSEYDESECAVFVPTPGPEQHECGHGFRADTCGHCARNRAAGVL